MDKKKACSKGKKAVDIVQPLGDVPLLAVVCDGSCDLMDYKTLDVLLTLPKDIVGVAFDQRVIFNNFIIVYFF